MGTQRVAHDALGSAVGLVDSSSATHHRYDAWGAYRGGDEGWSAPAAGQASLGYTGHAYDADTGLTYAQQRWYSPQMGRFLSEDPVGAEAHLATPQGLNPWLYANGNPTRYTDPDGRTGVLTVPDPVYMRKTLGEAVDVANKYWSSLGNEEAEKLDSRGHNWSASTVATGQQAATAFALGIPTLLARPEAVIHGVATLPGRLKRHCLDGPENWERLDADARWNVGWLNTGECIRAGSETVLLLAPMARGVGRAVGATGDVAAEATAQALREGVADVVGRPVPDVIPPPSVAVPVSMVEAAVGQDNSVARAGAAADLELGSTYEAMTSGPRQQLFYNQFPTHEIGPPIQTWTAATIKRNSFNRRVNYVVLDDGELIMGREFNLDVGGGHIDLAGGRPVLAAGSVHFVKSAIKEVDNSSGHCLPRGADAQAAAEAAFRRAGFEPAGKYVEKVWDPTREKRGAWIPKTEASGAR